MNWEAVGAIGEVVGAIGVIVTLGYLAVQIRANTAALKVEGARANRAAATPMNVAVAQDSELARIFNSGMADFAMLNPEEQTRFAFLVGDIIGNAANRYDEVTLGIIAEVDFQADRDIIAPYLNAPGGREFWRRFSGRYPAPFRDYVARKILED